MQHGFLKRNNRVYSLAFHLRRSDDLGHIFFFWLFNSTRFIEQISITILALMTRQAGETNFKHAF